MATYAPKLASAANTDEFCAELTHSCQSAGLRHFLAIQYSDDDLTRVLQLHHNAPPEAVDDVKTASHWSIGRLLERLRRSPLPVHFGRHQHIGLELPGYMSGVAALARNRRGGIVLCYGQPSADLDTSRLIHTMGQLLVDANLCIESLATLQTQASPFSQQELACLEQALLGLSSKQTALQLGISHRTVEHHLQSARKRTAARTSMAAAYEAVRQGWLRPPAGGVEEATG